MAGGRNVVRRAGSRGGTQFPVFRRPRGICVWKRSFAREAPRRCLFICFRWMVRLSTHLAVSGHSTARCENSWERFWIPGSPPSIALWAWDRNRRGKSPAAGYVLGMSRVRPDPVVRTALGYAVCGLVGTEGLPVIVRRRPRKSDCSNDMSA